MPPLQIVVASRNPGKLRELGQLLSDLPLEWISAETAELPDVEETGATYIENARLKARAALRSTGHAGLGEDSGIEIDALCGEPGVYSSRFAGPDATDDERNRIILERLAAVPGPERGCRYRSAVVLALPEGREIVCEGTCEGRISAAPRGSGGFGYDPIFLLPDRDVTMAEVTAEEKNRISHRGRALARFHQALREYLFAETGPASGEAPPPP